MNIDFHYYGTYVAARLAGFDFTSAQTISHAAQYVDDSDEGTLKDELNRYYIQDFMPIPTVQGLTDMMAKNFFWSEGSLKSIADIWIPFHFLPGNYGDTGNIKQYTGPQSDHGLLYSWTYDKDAENKFKLLCQPNSLLVKQMINDVIQYHSNNNYTLLLTGLRMHVLADTWAHMYYIGLPEWFTNNAAEEVTEIDGPKRTSVVWRRVWPWADSTDIIAGDTATPNMLAYNSIAYLGHGRMGHLPDYPWMTYEYQPQWSNTTITKSNSTYFLQAFTQMIKALECIKNGDFFELNSYATLDQATEQVINTILQTEHRDQCEAWVQNIPNIIVDGQHLEVPETYDKNKWLNEVKEKRSAQDTNYYYFNNGARLQLKLVTEALSANNIYIHGTPRETVVDTKFKSKKGKSIGPIYKEIQYYPKVQTTGITLQIIKPTPELLSSGDIVEIKTTETAVGKYNYLGAWETKALYYYTRAYNANKQKWQIEKISGQPGDPIDAGDQVRFKNMYFTNKPYMCTYDYSFGGTYLTTQADGNADNAIWIMDSLTEFNIMVVPPSYFVSTIIDLEISSAIQENMKTYGIIDAEGNVDIEVLRTTLKNIGLGFLDVRLSQNQQEQVLIQLNKIVNTE